MSRPHPPERHESSVRGGPDRRRSPRKPAAAVPYLKARLVAGPDVRIIDVSRRGILLETETRLLPNSPIAIRFVAADASLVLKGCVVRSSIAQLTGVELRYRTAVAFEEDIRLCDDSLWQEDVAVPTAANEHGGAGPEARGHDDVAENAAQVVTAVVESTGDELRHMLLANDW
jgi:hypothetical protein